MATNPTCLVLETQTMMQIIKMFDEADVWQLPLFDENRKFKGFVSRSAILNNYRQLLREYSE